MSTAWWRRFRSLNPVAYRTGAGRDAGFGGRVPRGEVIRSTEEWLRLAPPEGGVSQWKDWRRAKELARAWFRTGRASVPAELGTLFATHPWTRGLIVVRAVPEMPLRLDRRRGKDRQCDLMLVAEVAEEGILVTIEAKADEPFGSSIGKRRQAGVAKRGSQIPNQIDDLLLAVLGVTYVQSDDATNGLRYQLLQGVAGALSEDGRRGLHRAAFFVHEFHSAALDPPKIVGNAAALTGFVRQLTRRTDATVSAGQFVGPVCVPGGRLIPCGVQLLLGKVVTQLVAPGFVEQSL